MQEISPFNHHKTSISLRHASHRRVKAAQKILARNGIHFSEQRIYQSLFKIYLISWRGRKLKSATLRRYNADGYAYEVHPLYINQVLHAALWQRAVHSGESISRMLDFAIRHYMARLLEEFLHTPTRRNVRSVRNAAYWAMRLARRRHPFSGYFIKYVCETRRNDIDGLEYLQHAKIIPKKGLSAAEMGYYLQTAA